MLSGAGATPAAWRNWGSGHAVAAYYKDGGGRVYFKGLILCEGGACGYSTGIMRLPEGMRPAEAELLPALCHDGTKVVSCRINVWPDGYVQRASDTGGVTWLSLAGVSFRAAS